MVKGTCRSESCQRMVFAQGYCHSCYNRLWGTGEIQRVRPHRRRGFLEQWIAEMQQERPAECWPWPRGINDDGYGWACFYGIRGLAHKVVYRLVVGEVPAGLELDHRCHTDAARSGACSGGNDCPHRRCANPGHLELVTRQENCLRQARKTHCPNGHPYTDENVIQGANRRSCRACRRARNARCTDRRREARRLGRVS